VDLAGGEVRKAGLRQKLGGQPFQILQALLERPGEIVTREELRQHIWPDNTFVDYALGLKKAVNRLREALGDSADRPRFIETVPRRGYRFIGVISPPTVRLESPESLSMVPPDLPERPAGQSGRKTTWRAIAAFSLAASLILLLWLNADQLRSRIFAHSRRVQIHSIAVLPLQNLSNDADQEYFTEGMTDALITDLAQIASLKVISRTSVMRFKTTDKSLPEIARELNVDGIVEGSVQRSGGRVRINIQLVHGSSDQHLWARSYDRELGDTLQLQGEVAEDIAERVSAKLAGPGQLHGLSIALNIYAYDDYLMGRQYVRRLKRDNVIKGIQFLERSIQGDPNYAPAYAELSDAYQILAAFNHFPPREVLPKARAAAARALELNENLAEAHVYMGAVLGEYELNWPAEQREIRRALQLDENSSLAHAMYADNLLLLGRKNEATEEIKAALELDPFSPFVHSVAAGLFIWTREFDQAISEARRAVEIDPSFAHGHLVLAGALGRKGEFDEAFEEWLRYLALDGDEELAQLLRGAATQLSDRGDPGRKLGHITLGYYRQKGEREYVAAFTIAMTHWDLGEKDQTLRWLDKAYEERCTSLYTLALDPSFDPLRSDPRFQNLLHRMNLPSQSAPEYPN
jgi:TolB-like protein/DNA-binding winged helix-turn-helix (wHTH) protein